MDLIAQPTAVSCEATPWWRTPLASAERKRLGILAAIVLAYAALANAAAILVGGETASVFYRLNDHTLLVIGASLALIGLTHVIVTVINEPRLSVLARLWGDLKTHVLRRDRFLSLFVPLGLLPLFIPAFLTLKSLIPDVHPFAFDATFHALDQAIHFGHDPWRITHALFGGPSATFALSFLYNLWFLLIWGVAFYVILRVDRPVERFHYLCALLVAWVLNGTLLAYLFSSAGPCYFGFIVDGPNPYQPLMDGLHALDARLAAEGSWMRIWTLEAQNALWAQHGTGDAATLGGISAMPSMHVSLSLVMAMGMWRFSRAFSAALWVYAAAIFIGSVHFGWHYAVDGYVSLIATVLIWKGLGHAIKRFGLDGAMPSTGESPSCG